MKKLAIFILLLLHITTFGQKQGNIWYFGDGLGLDFNSVPPVALTNGATHILNYSHLEGTTAISDSSGSLLFYSDGQSLWNRNHQVTPNGGNLYGSTSSTQSSILVPQPQSSRFFYLFTIAEGFVNNGRFGFYYHKIDLCSDGGLGDIIEGSKNILLLDTVNEQVAVALHSNGMDYWVLTHKALSDAFYAYKLTSNGISDTIISHVGATTYGLQGQLKISPSGDRIAITSGQMFVQPCYLELFDFDKSSGVVSNSIPLVVPSNSITYGVEFSPDESKLYASYGSVSPVKMGIAQYNLSVNTQPSINNSMNILYEVMNVVTGKAIQLGPDNKIYGDALTGYLFSIDLPNNYGSASSLDTFAVDFQGKIISYFSPTFISGYAYTNNMYDCESGGTGFEPSSFNDSILLFPNPIIDELNVINKSGLEFELFIYSHLGEEVFLETVHEEQVSLNLSFLPSGVYFIKFIGKEGHFQTGKVVKQ